MSGPRASNPTTGPSLLDRSSAHPGSIDMAIFQKKSGGGAGSGQTTGQGTVNSNYLKECREDNPEPSAQDAAATATLLNCKIDTPPEKLVVDQPFEMSVEATGEGVAGGAITFRLFCATASADGKETFEDQSAVWSARAKDGKATFQGELLSPKKSVPLGTKLQYYVQASHPNAKEKADSPKVEAVFGKPPEVLAIWSLGAVHFGFGSSFIMPTVATEVSNLKKLLDQHSGSALAIFGHADPVGDDDSNKKLSGRRAYALHCLLTRNADGWVELSKGIEGDKWGTKAHQAILGQIKDASGTPFYGGSIHGNDDTQTKAAIEAYQKSAKLKADGIMGPQTKKSLYAAYMDQLCEVKLKPDDFVGDPSDKLVQWACSGCSEFNPVVVFSKSDEEAFKSSGNKAERDAKNAPNRRASLFLFPATAKGPGKVTFPCPAWSDGTANCKKQLFPNADKRRNPTDAERTWEAAQDTFGCQFYAEIGKGEKAGSAASGTLVGKSFVYTLPQKILKQSSAASQIETVTLWLSGIFGTSVPASIYEKLVQMIQQDRIEPAPCKILDASDSLLRGHDGGYDESNKTIYLSESLFTSADGFGSLASILTEEYGHHIENIIRSLHKDDYEAPKDEGACFAWHIMRTATQEKSPIDIGEVEGGDKYSTTSESLQSALDKILTDDEINWDDKSGSISYAGKALTIDDITELDFAGEKFKLITAYGSIAANSEVTIKSWGRSPAKIGIADAKNNMETVPTEYLDVIRKPSKLTRYTCGIDAQRKRVIDNEKKYTEFLAKEKEYQSSEKSYNLWKAQKANLEKLLNDRRKVLGSTIAREYMYNRFDDRISHWVDFYNKQEKPAQNLDANVVKSMIYQEGRFGTSGLHFKLPPHTWDFAESHPVKSRFNLMQAIDSLFQQQMMIIEEMDPTFFSGQKLPPNNETLATIKSKTVKRGKDIIVVWKDLSINNVMAHPDEAIAVLSAIKAFGIKQTAALGRKAPDGTQMGIYTDYDFWIRCGVFWLMHKYKVTAKSASWKEGVRRYNGGGPDSIKYRDAVYERVNNSASGQYYTGDV